MFTQDQLIMMVWRIFTPFLLVMAIVVLASFIYFLLKRSWLAAAGMPEIDRMSGKDFETKMALIFEAKGYRVEQTPYIGDWGADLVISRGGERTVAQIKRWKRKVDARAVQEVVAAKAKYGCQQALVVTNSTYTQRAVDLARVNGVELWNRARLARELLALNTGEIAAKLARVAEPLAPYVSASRPDTRQAHTETLPTASARPRCYNARDAAERGNSCGRSRVQAHAKCNSRNPVTLNNTIVENWLAARNWRRRRCRQWAPRKRRRWRWNRCGRWRRRGCG